MPTLFQHPINRDISFTYIKSSPKLTIVAACGVMIGTAIFIFMNSLMMGFNEKSDALMFKTNAPIRIYKDEEKSRPLVQPSDTGAIAVLVNPRIVPGNGGIVNPQKVIAQLRQQGFATVVTPQITLPLSYNSGNTQLPGVGLGVLIEEADRLFDIRSGITEGSIPALKNTPNGILLAIGVAGKMNVRTGDNITVTSSKGVSKVLKVVGLFETNNMAMDNTKSYVNISTARQLLLESSSYVSEINVGVDNNSKTTDYARQSSAVTGYKAEDWQEANASLVSANKVRSTMMSAVSLSILLVAAFGIFNILNMTINQKINEIAILKAMGFNGKDVVQIFVLQGTLIGLAGVILGLALATLLVQLLSGVYVGGDMGYFPIHFQPKIYGYGILIGLVISFIASYMPARKAAHVDPVTIIRK